MAQQLIVLGAGTALPDAERDNTSLVWDSPAGGLLIDCGGRAYGQLLRAGVDPCSLKSVLLTHSHPDHIYGAPALFFHLWLAGYSGVLDVYAEPRTLGIVQAMCKAMELPQRDHMCQVNWQTVSLAPANPLFANAQYRVATTPGAHSVPSVAVQIEDLLTGRRVVHSSDTAPCPAVVDIARDTDLLIHEATENDPSAGHGHTTPYQAGQIARDSGAKRLVLIHFSSSYTMPEIAALDQVRAAGYTGEATVARELDHYAL